MGTQDTTVSAVILKAFAMDDAKVEPLGKGLINATFLVTNNDQKVVLQRLSPIFDQGVIQDFVSVTDYLTKSGWDVPRIIQTVNGENYYEHENARWRAMTFIASDTTLRPETSQSYGAQGALLAKLHSTLKDFNYTPQHTIPHFHDTPYYINQLHDRLTRLADVGLTDFAAQVFATYEELPKTSFQSQQLIHGDPQTNNILFRQEKPFTFIDFDTVMIGTIWIDLGDMLRSIAETAAFAGEPFPGAQITSAIQGYYQASNLEASQDQFNQDALTATQQITLELTARFLNDVVDDSYFDWDPAKFTSRAQHNTYRAQIHWQIFESVETLRS